MVTKQQLSLAILTTKEVRQIRQLWAFGKLTQLELASVFGVSNKTISNIVNHNSWRNL